MTPNCPSDYRRTETSLLSGSFGEGGGIFLKRLHLCSGHFFPVGLLAWPDGLFEWLLAPPRPVSRPAIFLSESVTSWVISDIDFMVASRQTSAQAAPYKQR